MAPAAVDPAPPTSASLKIHKQLWAIKDTLIIILTPILLLPILFIYPTEIMCGGKRCTPLQLEAYYNFTNTTLQSINETFKGPIPQEGLSPAAGCAYTILIMIVYWMTEVLNMAVTALIPIVLFPWLGVMDSRQICTNYLKDANMLFFGGLLVAIAVEKWNLHKRVALRVLLLVGSKPVWIVFGFMMVTAFLSMWLNNTATTAMMMPIAHAVLEELDAGRKKEFDGAIPLVERRPSDAANAKDVEVTFKNGANSATTKDVDGIKETEPLQGGHSQERAQSDKQFMQFRKTLKLCVPFASSIGGCGTLIGCGPNIVFKGQLDSIYPGAETRINFTTWLVVGIPTMLIDIIGAWIILMLIFLGPRETFNCRSKKESSGGANQVIKTEYLKLGKISFAEVVVLINFIVLAIMWFMRKPDFIPGWGDAMSHKFVTDACLAITISVLLFIFPSRLPNYLCFRKAGDTTHPTPSPPILDWPTVNKQMPWSVILLLGGGFALADACKESGLSGDIGTQLGSFRTLDSSVTVVLCVLISTFITSFTSNMATTTILIPIMAELARETHVNPLYLMLPVTLAASYAFILPVSTPPNAIAYSYGDLVIMDMMKSGLAMCVLCVSVLLLAINTWGAAFFNLKEYPSWAPPCPLSTLLEGNSTIPGC